MTLPPRLYVGIDPWMQPDGVGLSPGAALAHATTAQRVAEYVPRRAPPSPLQEALFGAAWRLADSAPDLSPDSPAGAEVIVRRCFRCLVLLRAAVRDVVPPNSRLRDRNLAAVVVRGLGDAFQVQVFLDWDAAEPVRVVHAPARVTRDGVAHDHLVRVPVLPAHVYAPHDPSLHALQVLREALGLPHEEVLEPGAARFFTAYPEELEP